MKILVIEDEYIVAENIAELLETEEYEVIIARDGIEGLETARRELPDLIICDIMMPNLDGYGVLKELQKNEMTSAIPFIFLTAKNTKEDLRHGMNLGADDYLPKPFTPEELYNAVNSRLKKSQVIKNSTEKKINKIRDSIATTLPHELRTPLNGIMGTTQFLIEYIDQVDRNELIDSLHDIMSSSERLHELIVNYLLYAELVVITSDEDKCELLRKNIIENAAETIRNVFREYAIEFQSEADIKLAPVPCALAIKRGHFEKIVKEIAANSYKFTNENGAIEVFTKKTDGFYQIDVVTHSMVGISLDQMRMVGAFTQFGREVFEQQGAGLGLAIIKKICEIYGGKINIDEENERVKISIALPCAH
jgi:CheY-like chemotaxis protein